MGIPYSFLINRDGHIVWQGSPLEPALGEILPAVIAGTYDIDSAKIEAEKTVTIRKKVVLTPIMNKRRLENGFPADIAVRRISLFDYQVLQILIMLIEILI